MAITYNHSIQYLALIISLIFVSCNEKSVIHATRKNIVETVYASGKIVPDNEHWLSAQSNGVLLRKEVEDGDTVKKGQVLYVVSNEVAGKKYEAALENYRLISHNISENSPLLKDLSLAVHTAGVKLSNDSANYIRWNKLWSHDIGTKSNLDDAHSRYVVSMNEKKIAEQKYNSVLNDLQASLVSARSQLAAARKELDELYVYSDRDAIVYKTLKEAGESVIRGEQLILLGDEQGRIIRMSVDQQDIAKIRLGQRILLQVETQGTSLIEARVTFISHLMNEADQTFRVDARFCDSSQQSFIYTSLEANIIISTKDSALVLPRYVIENGDSIWIIQNGERRKIGVKTGISSLDYIEVVSGIDENIEVVVNKLDAR